MSINNQHKVSCKVWLELRGEPLIGKGGATILETIKQVESISKAAKKTGMSYRYVWNYLSKLERRIGEPVITTYKGGKKGGGGAKLTELGIKLLDEYKQAETNLTTTMGTQTSSSKIESENLVKGTIQNVTKKNETATIELTTKKPVNLLLIMPKRTLEDFNLQPNDEVAVTFKTSTVKITKESKIKP